MRSGERPAAPGKAGRPRAAKADGAALAARRLRASESASSAGYRRYLELTSEAIWHFSIHPAVRTGASPEKQAESVLQRAVLTECNAALARFCGFERPEDMIGALLSRLLAGSHDDQVRFVAQCIRSGYQLLDVEAAVQDRRGKTVWTLINLSVVVERGNIVGGWGSSRDITDRKTAEAALHASEERLQLALTAASDGVYDVDLRTGAAYYSPGYYTMLGYAPGEFEPSDQAWRSLLHPDDKERALEMLARCLSGEAAEAETEFRLRTKTGEWRRIRSRGRVVQRDSEGRALRLVGTHRDITAEWEAHEEVRRERDLAQAYLGIAEVMLVALDREGHVTLINGKGCRVLGYANPNEVVGKDWFATCLLPSAAQSTRAVFRKMMRGGVNAVEHYENPIVTTSGEQREIAWQNVLLRDSGGKVIGVLSSGEDITERRRVEEALQKTVALLSRSEEISHVGSWELDVVGNHLSWSDELYRIFGLRPQEFPPTNDLFLGTLHPEDREAVGAAYAKALREGEAAYENEHRLVRRRTGEVRHIHEKCSIVRDAAGTPVRVFGIVQDITEHRQAEAAVRESEEKYRLLVENAGEAVFVAQDGVLKFANPAAARILGRTPEDIASRPFSEFLHPDDRAMVVERYARRLAGEDVEVGYAFRVLRADGETRWVELSAVRIDWAGRPATLNFATDITARKQAEGELVERERRYRELANDLPTCVFEANPEGRLTFANRTGLDWFGYSEQELETGTTIFEMVTAEQRDRAAKTFRQALESGSVPTGEYTAIRKDGSTFPALISSRAIVKDGRPVGIRGILIDISERVEAARRVQNALSDTIRALAVTTEMRDPYTAGHQERVTQIACAIGREMRLSEDRLEGLRVAGTLHDVGKVSVPAEILSKPTVLTPTEFGLVKIHPESGYEILRAIHFPWPVADIVLQHHERIDGSGYPKGIRDGSILLEARILGVADVVEAIVSHRPYRPARPMAAAVEDVVRAAGTLYDADVVAACKRLFDEGRLPLME